MKKYSLYICSGAFVLLTAAKLLFPEHAALMRDKVLYLIDREVDLVETAEAMGRKLTEGGLGGEVVAVLGLEEEWTAVSGREPLKSVLNELEKGGEKLKSVIGKGTEMSETADMVQAFLEKQAAFAGYALPENVRADMPELPFVYGSPAEGELSSGFGYRIHPIDNEILFHYGVDYAAETGTEVRAFAGGSVEETGTGEAYGNYIILSHEGGVSSLYAHLEEINVSEGDVVAQGEKIAVVGQTGKATGPHVHFELMMDGVYLNPEYYI